MPPSLLQLVPGTELSAFDADGATATYLAQTATGRHFRLTEPMYHLLMYLREPIAPADLALTLSQRSGIALTEEGVMQIVVTALAPAGLVMVHGAPPQLAGQTLRPARRADGALSMRWRRELLSGRRVQPLTARLSHAYRPRVAAALLGLIVLAHGAAYARLGFPPALEGMVAAAPIVIGALIVTSFVHEFGHLAACRYWGCPHGGLGVGLYLLAPVFFADVTATWRLPRWQRACVDVGGIYFQLLCTPVLVALYMATGQEAWLWAVVMCDLSALLNLNPFAKLDGYWLLSDVLGVTNLHERMRERVAALFGKASAPSPFGQVTPAASAALTVYLAASVLVWPVLLFYQAMIVAHALAIYPSLWQDVVYFTRVAGIGAPGGASADAPIVAQLMLQLIVVTAVLLQLGLTAADGLRSLAQAARRRRSVDERS